MAVDEGKRSFSHPAKAGHIARRRHISHLRSKYIARGWGRAYRASADRREAFDGSDLESFRLAPLIRPLRVHLLPEEKAEVTITKRLIRPPFGGHLLQPEKAKARRLFWWR